MKTSDVRAQFERVIGFVDVLKEIDEEAYCSITLGISEATIGFFPSDKAKREATRAAVRLFGKLIKDKGGNLTGKREGISLTLFGVLKCVIVGYKKERRPKVSESEFVEVEVPVYECLSPIVPRPSEEIAEEVTNEQGY